MQYLILSQNLYNFFLFRQYRHIRRQVNVFSSLGNGTQGNFGDGTQRNFGDGTQGNFQWKNVSTEFESMAFSQLNEICLEVFVYNDLKCAQF